MDFPGGSDGKVCVYNAGDLGSIPGSGRFPGEGNGNPLQYSCLENPMDGGAWCSLLRMGSQRVGHDWATSLSLSLWRWRGNSGELEEECKETKSVKPWVRDSRTVLGSKMTSKYLYVGCLLAVHMTSQVWPVTCWVSWCLNFHWWGLQDFTWQAVPHPFLSLCQCPGICFFAVSLSW